MPQSPRPSWPLACTLVALSYWAWHVGLNVLAAVAVLFAALEGTLHVVSKGADIWEAYQRLRR